MDFKKIFDKLPGHVYWVDKRGYCLGCNNSYLSFLKIRSKKDIIGKKPSDLIQDRGISIKNKEVKKKISKKISTRKHTFVERIYIFPNGSEKFFVIYNFLIPLKKGKIFFEYDVTEFHKKEKQLRNLIFSIKKTKHKTEVYLDSLTKLVPASVYWKDRNSVILGDNLFHAQMAGFSKSEDVIGKTDFEFIWKDQAERIIENDKLVMESGETHSFEEAAVLSDGTMHTFLTSKAPLLDKNGQVIGTIGVSLDISDRKEAARLKLEMEVQRNSAQQQEKFVKVANQVAHDIRSPLASLLMIVKSCKEIPEADRIALREASVGISDIANNLLSRYQKKEPDSETQEKQSILVSTVLMQIVTEKKYQYHNLSVKFDCDFSPNSYFVFINISPSSLKRMLSNLINNAVDAFEKKPGKVDLTVDANPEWVKILIQDNGKGMPEAVVNKIMKNIAVTAGKESGHGIGFTQVREALQSSHGEMTIDSSVGKGAKITLTFPRIKTPHWIAEEIVLGKEDVIVILDDDTSIHGAWDVQFESILQQAPTLQLKHFTIGSEALSYINALPEEQKSKIFLLTDYELLKQELNGLHVIAQSGTKRSILVTSHYANPLIQNQAAKTGTKILPKQLASEVSIKILETVEIQKQDQPLQSVDIIVVDDDERFVRNLVAFAFEDKIVDKYHNPEHFLQNITKYDKKTKIFIDNNFANSSLKGLDIAEQLHEQGYKCLYILSGDDFSNIDVPSYVVVIRKDDIEKIKNS